MGPMSALLALLIFSLPFSSLLPAVAPPQNGDFRISTDVELVLLDVSVKDAKGGYVSGLTKDDFHVSESGAPQNITVFSHADVPITAGLVMDASGSMLHKQQDVIMAGLVFAGASNPRDQLFVVNFNDSVRPGLPGNLPFSDQPPVLRLALSRARPEGRTALYDAVAYALDHLNAGDREKKALVLVTDGGDNCSKLTAPELMGLIERSHATIYTVGLFDEDDPDRNPRILNRIAHISGGECFLPQRLDEVIPICKKIAEDIRNRYTLGYVPGPAGVKAGTHHIKVVASAAGREHLTVRTRTSYSLAERAISSAQKDGSGK
jgi:Ca-activated chloride channel family protein